MTRHDLSFEDELLARRTADEWAIKRGFMSIDDFQHKSFVGASVKLPGKGWVRFPGLRVPAAVTVIGPEPPPPPNKPTPQRILDRDAARAEARRQALQLDRTLAAADRYIAGQLAKTMPLDVDEQLSPGEKQAIRAERVREPAE